MTNKNRLSNPDISTMVYGKIPPQAIDIETAVLGMIMLDKESFEIINSYLKPECFYRDSHQMIYTCMTEMNRNGIPIDTRTVVEQLKKMELLDIVGGQYYVVQLTSNVISAAHAVHYCRILFEAYYKREVIRISGEMIGAAYEDRSDAFELVDTMEKSITELSMKKVGQDIPGLDTLMVERFQRTNELRKNESHITGISSGFVEIDNITHGWQNSDLIILAARPSVGKTALALNFALNAAKLKVPVAFFSLEMSAGQLTDRTLSCESEIHLDRIMNGRMDDAMMNGLYTKGLQPLSSTKLFIDDTPALNVFELRGKLRRLKRKHNIGIAFIDYLQLMSGVNDGERRNREQEISFISRSLKGVAKELNIPIIALSQLNRSTETRKGDNKMPQLSDLRESGAIEQDADMVMAMYRPEYYDETSNEMGESTKGETRIDILKHRNGKIAKGKEGIRLRADLGIQKFFPWDTLGDKIKTLGPGNWRPVSSEREDVF